MTSLGSFAIAMALLATTEERIVCVPGASGVGWECGKGEQAPAARSLPRTQSLVPSTPPPYLIDPASIPWVTMEEPPVAAPAPDPVPVPAPTPEPKPVPEPAPVPEPVAVPAPTPGPVPEQAPAIQPAAVTEAAAAPEPVTAPTPMPISAPAAVPTPPPAAVAAPVTRAISSVARDAADLLALPGSGYTVQLAAARGIHGFTAFRQQLGIAVEDTFVIRVRRDNEDWWLMLWRDFPDLASARSAAATLSAHGNFWPRRLEPLQGAVRATPN